MPELSRSAGNFGGFDVSQWNTAIKNRILVTVTDQTSDDDIQQLGAQLVNWVLYKGERQ